MDYDEVFGVHCSLGLASSRKITLDKLTQTRTYVGVLEGTPNKKKNDELIERTLEQLRRLPHSEGEPLLIAPQRREYSIKPGDRQGGMRSGIFGDPPEWLPLVVCVGRFHSTFPCNHPNHDRSKDASSLTVVWYQDDFGIERRAIEQLKLIDWDEHATDFAY